MEREGDIIHFNDLDRSRCPDLAISEWMPAEDASGLHEQLSRAHILAEEERAGLQSLEVMDMPESMRCFKLSAIDRRLSNLGMLKAQLFNVAPEEILAMVSLNEVLPGIDL